MKKENR